LTTRRVIRARDALARLPRSRAFAYSALIALQVRALWGVWDKDIPAGDTPWYFLDGAGFLAEGTFRLAWSPLYAVYIGSIEAVFGNAVDTVMIQRALLVLVLAVLVLAILRRLVPPWAALLGACWWAGLPSIFDTTFAVHLFGVVPLWAAAWLLSDGPSPSPRRKGAVIGLLAVSAILVRNEALFVLIPLVAVMLAAEWKRGGSDRRATMRRAGRMVGVPALVAVIVLAVAFARSNEREHQYASFDAKHRLNVCQVYLDNYRERNPNYGLPKNECGALMRRDFGVPRPSFTEAWRTSPGAMAEFTAHHIRTLPQGAELALFGASYGDAEPALVPPSDTDRPEALVLLLLLLGLLLAGGWTLRAEWSTWRPRLRERRWAWLVVGLNAAVTLGVVVFTQGPTPDYMFGLTFALIAAAVLSAAVLARRYGAEGWLAALAALAPLLLAVALPVHYRSEASTLTNDYERVHPEMRETHDRDQQRRLVTTLADGSLCTYLLAPQTCIEWVRSPELPGAKTAAEIEALLDASDAELLYISPRGVASRGLAELATGTDRWRLVRDGTDKVGPWALLERVEEGSS